MIQSEIKSIDASNTDALLVSKRSGNQDESAQANSNLAPGLSNFVFYRIVFVVSVVSIKSVSYS